MTIVHDFLRDLEKSKPQAARLYKYAFQAYAKYFNIPFEVLDLRNVKKPMVEEFIANVKNPYTANSFIAAVRSFAKYVYNNFGTSLEDILVAEKVYKTLNSVKYLPTPELTREEALTEEELEKLHDNIKSDETRIGFILYFYFGARPIELVHMRSDEIEFKKLDKLCIDRKCVVDFDKHIIFIPTAKGKLRGRILPYNSGLDEYLEQFIRLKVWRSARPNEWFTKRIKTAAKKIGIKVTARTARKTFETLMTIKRVSPWAINYWLGHKGGVPDIYKDKVKLLDFLRENIVENHYMNRFL